jgi:hypothetical protein
MRQRTWLTLVGGILVGGIMLGSVLVRAQAPVTEQQRTLEERTAATYRALVQAAAEQKFRSRVSVQADNAISTGGQTTFTGVSIKVDGVTVLADRAVIRDGEYQLEGNVRLKLEAPTPPPTP